jgi:hypothetical protein
MLAAMKRRRLAAAAFVPTDISGCELWLRADMGVTDAGAGAVSAWADQSGNGYSATQGTAGKRPTFTSAVASLNSQDALSHDGGDSLEVASFAFPATFSLFMVHKTTAGLRAYVHHDGSAARRYIYTAGSPHAMYQNQTSSLRSMRNATSFTAHPANARIIGHRFAAGAGGHVLSSDGVDYTMTDFVEESPAALAVTGTLSLFSYQGGSEFVTGYLAEVLIYDSIVSGGDLTDLIAYLKARYGIA